jgi:O-antigen/teichoic acid export membrane protein
MSNKFKEMMKLSGNKRNVAKISGGTLLGQCISFITIPIFTRIYGAEIIGLWAFLHSITSIIGSFSDLGLTNAIMIGEDNEVEKTYKVITSIATIISILTGIFVTLYYTLISSTPSLSLPFLVIFMITLTFTSRQTQLCYTWLNRKGDYNILMKNPIINGGIFGIVGISLGLMGYTQYGYFIGSMAGQIITLIHMKRFLPNSMHTFKLQDYQSVFKNHRRLVIYQLPTNILSNFKNQLPTLLIKGLWGTEMVGYYSITIRMLNIPVSLLATAIGRVFFQITSTMKREGKAIGGYVYNNLITAMKIGFLPIILLMTFGDIAAVIFLGSEWRIAGDFIIILSLQYFFMFLMMSVQGLSITLDKQNYAMVSVVAQIFAYSIGAFVGRYIFNDIYVALTLMSALFIIINVTYFCTLFKVMEIPWGKYLRQVVLYITIILGFTAVLRFGMNALEIFNWTSCIIK